MRIDEYVKIEMVGSIAEVFLFAAIFAWFELHAQTGNPTILDHFSMWNMVMLLAALLIFSVPFVGAWIREEYVKVIAVVSGDILLWVTLEDVFWNLESGNWPNQSAWINWLFGGFALSGIWVPALYVFGPLVSIILYMIGFNFSD